MKSGRHVGQSIPEVEIHQGRGTHALLFKITSARCSRDTHRSNVSGGFSRELAGETNAGFAVESGKSISVCQSERTLVFRSVQSDGLAVINLKEVVTDSRVGGVHCPLIVHKPTEAQVSAPEIDIAHIPVGHDHVCTLGCHVGGRDHAKGNLSHAPGHCRNDRGCLSRGHCLGRGRIKPCCKHLLVDGRVDGGLDVGTNILAVQEK